MKELVMRYIDKTCIVNTTFGQHVGVVKAVEENAVLIDTKGGPEIINLDYVVRLREKSNKKGK